MKRQGGLLIAKVHQTAGRVFARMLRERGIPTNPALGRVLFVLWERGPLPIHELARQVGLGKSTLTSALDRLESQGQVRRVRSPEDRRSIRVELAPKNQALHGLYDEVSQEMIDLFYEGIPASRIAEFERTLGQILENLSRHE